MGKHSLILWVVRNLLPSPSGPFFFIGHNDDLEVVQQDDGCTIKPPSQGMGVMLFSLPFIFIGLMFIIIGLVMSGSAVAQVWFGKDQTCLLSESEPIVLGDGQVFCFDSTFTERYDGLETDEEHFKYFRDGDVDEYRWSVQGDYVVIGTLFEDNYYGCLTYVPSSALNENWTYDDIVDPSVWDRLPDWCAEQPTNNEANYSPQDEPPFVAEFFVMVDSDYYGSLTILQFTNQSIIETLYQEDYEETGLDILLPLTFSAIGFGVIRFVDDRTYTLTYHRSTKKLKLRKSFGGTRWTGKTWNDVDMDKVSLSNGVISLSLGDENIKLIQCDGETEINNVGVLLNQIADGWGIAPLYQPSTTFDSTDAKVVPEVETLAEDTIEDTMSDNQEHSSSPFWSEISKE